MRNTKLTFPDYRGQGTVTLHIWRLIQWRGAIRLEEKGIKVARLSVTAHARKHLNAPRSATRQNLIDFIQKQIDAHHALLSDRRTEWDSRKI